MQVKTWQTYSMTGLMDKLDVIECFEQPKHSLLIGEILEK
jgi:hypothetical protein